MRWVLSCEVTARSRIFDRKGRLEMGRKLFGLSGSRPGFLMMGVMAASLRVWGTEPEQREALMKSMMSGEITGRQSLMSLEGMGSRLQVEVFIPVMMVVNCAGDTGVKWVRCWIVVGGEMGGILEVLRLL